MTHSKESLALKAGLHHILELATNKPLEADQAIHKLRPSGISQVHNSEDCILAFCHGRALRQIDRFDDAVRLLSLALKHALSKGLLDFAADCERDLAGVYIAQGDVENGIPHAERALELAQTEDNPLSIASSKQKLATLLAMKGEDDLSVQYYLEAINVFERLDPKQVHSALNNYSHHFFKRGDSEAGLKLVEEAAAKCEEPGGKSIYLLNIATANLDLGNKAAALEAARESMELARKFGRPSTFEKAKMIYLHALDNEESAQLFERSIDAVQEAAQCFNRLEHLPSKALSLVYLAKSAALKGKCQEAMDHLNEARSLELTDRVLWELVFAQTIEEVQKECSNWADAYSALKTFDQISASLRASESTRMLYANPVGALREHDIDHGENEALKAQLDQRSKDIIAMREESAQVRTEIDSIITFARDRDTLVRALRKQINSIPERPDYASFEKEFVSTYPTFQSTLKSIYPDLTDIQLRICSVTRAGMRSPEAAKLLNLSERTIQNHRYRIKKTLGLEPTESLQRFLKRF
jgi:tetratricopeptide (TPR) repeat protein